MTLVTRPLPSLCALDTRGTTFLREALLIALCYRLSRRRRAEMNQIWLNPARAAGKRAAGQGTLGRKRKSRRARL